MNDRRSLFLRGLSSAIEEPLLDDPAAELLEEEDEDEEEDWEDDEDFDDEEDEDFEEFDDEKS